MTYPTMPIIRIQMEGIRETIAYSLDQRNIEFGKTIEKVLEDKLTEEWVMREIEQGVENCLREAIRNLTSNYNLQRALEDQLGKSIANMIKTIDQESN